MTTNNSSLQPPLPIPLREGETLDDLLHGQLKLIQSRRGWRYGVDALLLAHFALPVVAAREVLDLGAGNGVVALILACRGRPARVVGVELQDGLFDQAERNARLNPTSPRVQMVRADARDLSGLFAPGSFDLVATNPPFRPRDSGRASPCPERAAARHELWMNLVDWLREARRLVRDQGRLCVVYPVDRERQLMEAAQGLELGLGRRAYALDRPGGKRKLVLAEFLPGPGDRLDLPDIPIQTDQGKFSLDGWQ